MKKIILLISAICCVVCVSEARKKGYRLNIDKSAAKTEEVTEMVRGSFMVASQCTDCNNGYRLAEVTFSGFDKPQNSNTETFFITNGTDRTLTGVNLYIDYRMPDGRQLNKRFIRLTCNIPPGETRMADIPTWDKQKSFYYEKSVSSKKGGTSFTVNFDPVAYYLRF